MVSYPIASSRQHYLAHLLLNKLLLGFIAQIKLSLNQGLSFCAWNPLNSLIKAKKTNLTTHKKICISIPQELLF